MAHPPGRFRGSALLEFTFVGIPLMFLLISIFEIARGMWMYETLAHAIKDTSRLVITKGQNCATPPNACAITVQQIAQYIQNESLGLDANELTVTFTSSSRTIGPATLETLLSNTDYWPSAAPGAAVPDPGSNVGQPLLIEGQIPFRSAIAMLWPGGGGSVVFGTHTFRTSSRDRIQF